MARPRTAAKDEKPTIEFRDPPPPGRKAGTRWVTILEPLLKAKGRWAMIEEFEDPRQSHNARGNLDSRSVVIPFPDHDWGFAARGCELFAVYRGPKRPAQVTRRTRARKAS